MEKMLICHKDLSWFPKNTRRHLVNLLNPVSLQYIVQGGTYNYNHKKIFQKKVFKNNKYTDKLNEVLEILKSFQTIQHDAFNENVEDEFSFPTTSGGGNNYRISDYRYDLN